jgi:hypothetical protein
MIASFDPECGRQRKHWITPAERVHAHPIFVTWKLLAQEAFSQLADLVLVEIPDEISRELRRS